MHTETEFPILPFATSEVWRAWLAKNHTISSGIWLRFFKKASGVPSISYDQALDEALCYGWIDSQLKKYDEQSWVQKFTPRRPRSMWSSRNKTHAERLIAAGRMRAAGQKEITAAKEDGRWEAAYEPPSTMQVPEDFVEALSKNTAAKTFFETLNKANTYAIAWRLHTAKKPETRQRRIVEIIEMLAKGEKFHG